MFKIGFTALIYEQSHLGRNSNFSSEKNQFFSDTRLFSFLSFFTAFFSATIWFLFTSNLCHLFYSFNLHF